MSLSDDITQAQLKELFDYDASGTFVRRSNGKIVVQNLSKGQRYPRISVNGKPRSLHRIVFCWHHGYFPRVIDHINNDRLDNRIENLREATQSNNCLNRKHHGNSKSPYKNVYLQSPTKNSLWKRNWVVRVTVNGKSKYFGSYDDIELANLVAIEARAKHHGAFVNHGEI
jgi:hypothetical protein